MPSSSLVRVVDEVVDVHVKFATSLGGVWVLDLARLMLISTQVEVVVEVEVGVQLGKKIWSKNSLICLKFLLTQTILSWVYL